MSLTSSTFPNTRPPFAAGASDDRDRPIRLWLDVVIAMVFAMIVVGGATRLTDSGLSITEWLPILGAIPPLSDADWQIALEKYRQIPEYREINRGMSMAEFQFIYWWEWAHRFLGRMIGLVYAIPLAVFLFQGRIRRSMMPLMVGLLVLGGVQGFVGWYMVQSGLVDRVDVSQYRLALHLSVAFVILGLLVWARLKLTPRDEAIDLDTISPTQAAIAVVIVGLVFLQVALGAFVAGTKAGLTYNTWPPMDGEFVPSGLLAMSPWYLNFSENYTTIQFNHRTVAYIILALAAAHSLALWRSSDNERVILRGILVLVALLAQATIGIWTLLAAEGKIPIGLGLLHQGGGAVVFALAIWHVYWLFDSRRRA
jgi:cytochrome c oxidase assembly protein subunit 15